MKTKFTPHLCAPSGQSRHTTVPATILRASLAVVLLALGVTAQAASAAANATVSTAEVEAFIKEMQPGTNGAMPAYMTIPANPKRVPLLLAAIEREPSGPWVYYLQAFCFGIEHSGAFRLPPASRSEVYPQAIEYLTAAKGTVSKALEAAPRTGN